MCGDCHSRLPLFLCSFQYLDVIVKAWGTWALFQTLLAVLREIGNRHGRSIANIATRWVLDHSVVGAVIIGTCNVPFFSLMEIHLRDLIL